MFWTPDGESYMLSKNLALFEKSWFLHVLGRFCMRALWRGFDWKMLIFGPRSQFLAGSSHAAAISQKSARDWSLIGYRVGMVYPAISGIKSNNCVYFKAVCQFVWWLYGASLYGDCMEPGRDMNPTFYVLTPLQFWGCFGRVSAFCVHPCGFFPKKKLILTKI